jgi:hypothetical protein
MTLARSLETIEREERRVGRGVLGELRREHFVRGVGIRELARRFGLSRNTVRAALRSERSARLPLPAPPVEARPVPGRDRAAAARGAGMQNAAIASCVQSRRPAGAVPDYAAYLT